MPGKVEWLYDIESDNKPNDYYNHGTCVLAWAVSPKYGVAKKANMVIVKIPVYQKDNGDYSCSCGGLLASIYLSLGDIQKKGLQGKVVINISWSGKEKP
jgi:hypothetical protein